MSNRSHRLVAICHAILFVAGATTANASILTLTAASCTGFALSGVGPNQTLVCNFVTPPAPGLVSVVSRKVHGTAGTFDLPLSPGP